MEQVVCDNPIRRLVPLAEMRDSDGEVTLIGGLWRGWRCVRYRLFRFIMESSSQILHTSTSGIHIALKKPK